MRIRLLRGATGRNVRYFLLILRILSHEEKWYSRAVKTYREINYDIVRLLSLVVPH